jgi:hypothetical protein
MATEEQAHVGDIGTEIELDCVVDISGGDSFHMNVVKPGADSPSEELAAVLVDTTKVRYTTDASHWTTSGDYKYNPLVKYANGTQWYGNTYVRNVKALGEV